MTETAKVKSKMKFDSLRRGFIPKSYDCYMTPEQMIESMNSAVSNMNERRAELLFLMGNPNKQNLKNWKHRIHEHNKSHLLREYFQLGDSIHEMNTRRNKINKQIKIPDDEYIKQLMWAIKVLYGEDSITKAKELVEKHKIDLIDDSKWSEFVKSMD